MWVCVRVCVCVRERVCEGETERVFVRDRQVRVSKCFIDDTLAVIVFLNRFVRVNVCVCVCRRECVYERERERGRERERERESVCFIEARSATVVSLIGLRRLIGSPKLQIIFHSH